MLAPAFDEPDDTAVAGQGHHDGEVTFRVFQRLLKLKDADVGRIATFVMAETLAAGGAVVDAFGVHAKVETCAHWTPDQTFFDLLRDRDTVHAMLAEVSGKKAADKLVSAKLKDQRVALASAVATSQGWCPGWVRFPATGA